MKNKSKEDLYIQKYMSEILNPLDHFYTSNYKYLLNKNKEYQKIVENTYDLYLEKLETFEKLMERYIEKIRK